MQAAQAAQAAAQAAQAAQLAQATQAAQIAAMQRAQFDSMCDSSPSDPYYQNESEYYELGAVGGEGMNLSQFFECSDQAGMTDEDVLAQLQYQMQNLG